MKLKLLSILLLGLFAVSAAKAQSKTVSGTVTGKTDGLPLPGVSVTVKGTTAGTQTDANGHYNLAVPAETSVLVFSYLGYQSTEIPVAGQTTINATLTDDTRQLAEVVVTGYQTKMRTDVSSAISTVQGREVADRPVPSIDNLLQGKAAGVQITSENGRPGGNAYIRIRGVGSINAGQQPLLVVDGLQVPDDVAPQFYTTINANDIENVSVLKDAAAVSLYGARGSNGVIVITTKTGAGKDKPEIAYTFQYGTNAKIPDNFKLMTTAQKLQYEYDLGYENAEITSYLGQNNFPDGADLFNITDAQRQTVWDALIRQSHNWLNDILRTGKIRQHQLSVSGHENKTNYYVSFQMFDVDGIVVGSDYKRYTGKVNLSTQIKPWLSLSNNMSLGHKKTNELRDVYNAQNPFYAIYGYNSYEPVYNPDGTYNLTVQGFPILEALKENPETQRFLSGYNITTLDFHPIKGLNVSSSIGLTYDDYKRAAFIRPGSILDQYIGDPTAPGSKVDNGSTEFAYDWINKAIYKFDLNTDHHFNILAVQEFQKDQLDSYGLEKKGFVLSDYVSTQDNGAANTGTNTTSQSIWTIASLLGELDYNYKNKYYVTGSFRRDGSSRFGRNNRYGNFYSASLSWVLTNEEFMKPLTWVNALKLRGSVGTAGNFSGLGNYQSLSLYRFGTYNNLLTAFPAQIPNPDLTWEKKLKRDVGIDFELFNSRISGTFDYYNENTTALLLNVPVSQTTGFASVIKNVGAMNNSGIDISLNGEIIRSKDLRWSVYGNLNYNRNKITELYNGATEIADLNQLGTVKPGYAINTFKLVRYAGVNPETGAAQFYTKDGEITEEYSGDDAVILEGKSPNPKFFGGFGTNLNYKGFEFSADFTYTLGQYIFNYNKEILVSWGDQVYYPQAQEALNYWKQPGDTNVLPKPDPNNFTYDTDYYLQKASYIRLRNVTLGYTIPSAITQKYHVRNLRFFVTGQNLLTINPNNFFGDPEVGIGSEESFTTTIPGQATLFAYPTTRQFTFGVNLTF
ncbi:TonB-dependent receptor [Mucilaginibacter limnophilus]|uniref:TonB-dependent receptor n=1 Tax=Mucilaginibacter limnophilus TaxID=1932778 RepID=A0A437MU90_9SPHI|nr:TonB-dependent receptor [Mucilaginibacter limnophilus]RVU01238.1 TonB-dependent receptor [Mucilaginibacter limnophilus]